VNAKRNSGCSAEVPGKTTKGKKQFVGRATKRAHCVWYERDTATIRKKGFEGGKMAKKGMIKTMRLGKKTLKEELSTTQHRE